MTFIKTYIKFIVKNFLKTFFYVSFFLLSLIFIINLLSELEFFKNINVKPYFPIYMALLNAPSLTFEIFPFIFLISTQFFFIYLMNDNEIQIFKYSGLKNTKILFIITISSFLTGIFLIFLFYNFSSNLKNIYLKTKSNFTNDGKYLAVITKNGLWIKDKIDNKNLIIHSNKLEKNYLLDAFITELNENFVAIRNIKSKKINILEYNWKIYDPIIFENNNKVNKDFIFLKSNFNYKEIQNLFSNLSSLSIFELLELRNNYKLLNFSTVELNVHIHKLISYPFYLSIMTLISAILMFNTKNFRSYTFKIALGFFISVIIYYFNNFFNVLGVMEKITYIQAIWIPLIILGIFILIISRKINEK